MRRLDASNMAGAPADAVQSEYSAELEYEKLRFLTDAFEAAFGYRPRAFRAGRFGIGPNTFEALARLGYAVDSSVTPGIVWRYPQRTLDFSAWSTEPKFVDTAAGSLVELPVGVRPGGRLAALARRAPHPVARAMRGLLGSDRNGSLASPELERRHRAGPLCG